jgi:hypothetical protein
MQHAALQAGAPGGGVLGGSTGGVSRTPQEALALLSREEGTRGGVDGLDSHSDASAYGAAASLWFKKEAFTAPEFDPDEYVRDLQRFVRRPPHAFCSLPLWVVVGRCRLCQRACPLLTPSFLPQVPLESLRAALDAHLNALKTEVRAGGDAAEHGTRRSQNKTTHAARTQRNATHG